ncbi:hypothetical protein BH23VER1_BH23VER1_06580 [soil metagenome]
MSASLVHPVPDPSQPRPAPRDFVERSNLRGWGAVLRDCALIAGIAWASISLSHPLAYLVAVWAIGLLQLGLGEALTHEASHYNLFRTRRLNDLGEIVYCLPFFFTLADYRREHREHHLYLNTDREKLHDDYASFGLLSPKRKMAWIWFVKPLLGYAGWSYLRSVVALISPRSAWKILTFWTVVGTAALLAGHLDVLVLYWIVPLLWSFASFFYWSEIEDHYNTECGARTNVGWTNLFTHNNGYHYAHHRYPTIPWYRLPQAHRTLFPQNPDLSKGFLDTFKQISRRDSSTGSTLAKDSPDSPDSPD